MLLAAQQIRQFTPITSTSPMAVKKFWKSRQSCVWYCSNIITAVQRGRGPVSTAAAIMREHYVELVLDGFVPRSLLMASLHDRAHQL